MTKGQGAPVSIKYYSDIQAFTFLSFQFFCPIMCLYVPCCNVRYDFYYVSLRSV